MRSTPLYRLAAAAGIACAAILLVNAARRGGLIPENALTHAIAPWSILFGLFTFTGLYLRQRTESGPLGAAGYALNFAGLAAAFAVEYTLHFVFPYLPGAQITALTGGGTGKAFLASSLLLAVGVLAFAGASWRARVLPLPPVILYALGLLPVALRTLVPLPVYLTGLVVTAAAVAWLSITLWREAPILQAEFAAAGRA
ncbi:hypothetical protein J5X84_26580 [Streptosporangiaceae bacterium NEAU-GS5]|nr:hypothetical protein [Streptosporangiaceae bacterium NEAU-GS5]